MSKPRIAKFPFPSHYTVDERMTMIKLVCAQERTSGWNVESEKSYLYKFGYPNIDDWDRSNVAMADGFQLTLVKG